MGLRKERAVRGRASHARGNVHHPPTDFIDGDLTVERMLFRVATIQLVGGGMVTRALDALCKGIDHDQQLRRIPHQVIEGALALCARIRQAHGITAGGFQNGQHTRNHP